MFFISLGLAGMNTADILNIKNKNIKSNNELEYIREKTKDRTTKRIVINMKIPPEVITLINKYAALNPEEPEEYILPFYNNTMTEKQRLRKRKDINRKIDRSLKDICYNLGIPPVTTYWARHTFATKLYNAGDSPAVISKLLGHSSIKTTDIYLGRLGLDKKEEVATHVSSILAGLQI
jgi:integrase